MNKKKIRVAVLFGGVSSEHEISLMSVQSVLRNMPEDYEVLTIGITKDGRWVEYTGSIDEITDQKWEQDQNLRTAVVSPDRSHKGILLIDKDQVTVVPVDICFPVLHGKHGEDGTIQGLFQLAGIPFVGCNMISSANCMDKEMTHTILEANGIKMAKWVIVNGEKMNDFENFAKDAEEKLGYPMFVKPANAGSSVGVGKAHNREELKSACETALKEDYKAVVEECIEMQEVETAVLGNGDPKAAGVVGELVPVVNFIPMRQKYIDGTTVLHIPEEYRKKLRSNCARPQRRHSRQLDVKDSPYRLLCTQIGWRGHLKRNQYHSRIYLNQHVSKLWDYCGVSYSELIDRLIRLGLERK